MTAWSEVSAWACAAFLLLTAFSGFYYLGVCGACRRFLHERRRADQLAKPVESEFPPVSILKPVAGADPAFYENIRSHALLDYPQFELLFGAADPHDPALEAVARLAREFPGRRIESFVCDCRAPGNPKVLRLERLEQEARFDLLLVNDSDIQVDRDYLRRVVQPFLDPQRGARVGLVSCPYRARPRGTTASLLESLCISAGFQSQVLLARVTERVRWALGATMAVRRRELEQVGGFHTLAPYLADDYRLGHEVSALGKEVVISTHAVEIQLGSDGWSEVWRRQLRWSRTVRACRPGGHAGLFLTQGWLWAPLCLAALWIAGWPAAWGLLPIAVLVLRLAAAWLTGWSCLRSEAVRRHLWWVFGADVLSFAVWLASFFVRQVHWRNKVLKIGKDGRIDEFLAP